MKSVSSKQPDCGCMSVHHVWKNASDQKLEEKITFSFMPFMLMESEQV